MTDHRSNDHLMAEGTLLIDEPGVLTTVQDLGRPGYAHLGVTTSGAADRDSMTLANRLVGNVENTPALEVTTGGLRARLTATRTVAVTGAPAPVHINDRPVAEPRRFLLRSGEVLAVGRPTIGLRTYLAVSGGLAVSAVLGAACYDSLAELGPLPLRSGDVVPLGAPVPPSEVPVDVAVSRVPASSVEVGFRWGPRHDMFDAADRARFVGTRWCVSPSTNRVAARLTGDPLRLSEGKLPSEGMVCGAIQVPPSGEPIVFLADHPVTGGYPVIGVVRDCDIARISQVRPGTRIRFRAVSQPVPSSAPARA